MHAPLSLSLSRLARKLLWATLSEGAQRVGHPRKSLPQTYHDLLASLDLGDARRKWQGERAAEGESLFGFCWLHACADRDAWRKWWIITPS